jgi:hypothetical protein
MFLKLFKLDKPVQPEQVEAEPAPAAVAEPQAAFAAEPQATVSAEPQAAAAASVPAAANDTGEAEGAAAAAAPEASARTAFKSFVTTANLEPLEGPLGQDAALKALRLGAGIKGPGFHVLALGAGAAQMAAAARYVLEPLARDVAAGADWLYVCDLDRPHMKRALRLPAGRAEAFAAGLAEAVAELGSAVPQAFGSDDYKLRRRAIEEEARAAHEHHFDAFTLAAQAQNIAVLRTPAGYALAPMHDGKVVKPDVFQRLPDHMRQSVEARVAAMQAELTALLGAAPALDREARRRAALLDEETARYVAEPVVADLASRFADVPEAGAFLAGLAADVARNARLFLPAGAEAELARYLASPASPAARRAESGALVVESDVTPERLFGEAVACATAPAGVSIKAGALAAANGGYLVLDARSLLADPGIWPLLRRALSSGELAPIVKSGAGTSHIEVEPIPLKVKVVLLGDAASEAYLAGIDPDFKALFGITARFETAVPRDAESEDAFARCIAAVVREHDLLPFDAGAVQRIADGLTSEIGGRRCLSLDRGALAGLLRETDYWARERGAAVAAARDVETATAERAARGAAPGAAPAAEAGSERA